MSMCGATWIIDDVTHLIGTRIFVGANFFWQFDFRIVLQNFEVYISMSVTSKLHQN